MFERGIEIKTPAQIASMRAAGLVVASALELLRETAKAGMTTA
jgi:methionyl aminopeptidase